MATGLPMVYIVRHGQTAWSLSGQHTGRSDIPLTEQGEKNAQALAQRLQGVTFARVLTSPLQRARRTCEIAGFGAVAELDADLMEWDYGAYEGLTSAQIRTQRPDWQLFRDGCPQGETLTELGARADRVVRRARSINANVLLFSSSHFLRVLTARWLGLEPSAGRLFALDTASVSVLGYEHDPSEPVLRLWNDHRPAGS